MKEKDLYIVRCGEVALKGMNKPYFERVLLERVKKSLSKFNDIEAKWIEGLMILRVPFGTDKQAVLKRVSKVFGVATISPAIKVEKDINIVGEAASKFVSEICEAENIKTFKVKAKRADKSFNIKSPEIGSMIGASILKNNNIKVDVKNPDLKIFIDVRREGAYIYRDKIKGYGGLPLGTNGKGLVLLSGGIDSPVAAFLMAKRGMTIETIHFHSYPYTSQRAKKKVEDLLKIISSYIGDTKMYVVNLLPIQEEIVKNCPEDETTLLVRRFMMKIAEKVAKEKDDMMLITGEDLGQVASQTAEALVVTDAAVDIPVMRPLIAMDKIDIMDIAKDIGTYNKSIEPYEDCCTVFLPKHPVTKPKLKNILKSENRLDADKLIEDAISGMEVIDIKSQMN